jgi:hypothetical protein
MRKYLYISIGSLFVALGVVGVVVPGLPTTVFLLIAAAFYAKSSDKLYNWLLNHKIFGEYIRNYRQYRAMPLKSKVIALVMMWTAISASTIFFIESNIIRVIVLTAGVVGTIVIYRIRTLQVES